VRRALALARTSGLQDRTCVGCGSRFVKLGLSRGAGILELDSHCLIRAEGASNRAWISSSFLRCESHDCCFVGNRAPLWLANRWTCAPGPRSCRIPDRACHAIIVLLTRLRTLGDFEHSGQDAYAILKHSLGEIRSRFLDTPELRLRGVYLRMSRAQSLIGAICTWRRGRSRRSSESQMARLCAASLILDSVTNFLWSVLTCEDRMVCSCGGRC
jgi:hypothetical protein